MLVQIYEIQNPMEAKSVAEAGADHIGVLVGDGEFPREFAIEEAHRILDAIPASSRRVVLTLSIGRKAIESIARNLEPDILHIGSLLEGVSAGDVRHLKRTFPWLKIMRSIPVTGEQSIDWAMQFDPVVDFLLLDSHKEKDNQIGATGVIHDWNISRKIVECAHVPVILAGGLGPENVAEAIRHVRPAGVDSKTLTDKAGTHQKDLEKVKRFVQQAKSAADFRNG
jgi:phosphoribosylanthranilate isomerase